MNEHYWQCQCKNQLNFHFHLNSKFYRVSQKKHMILLIIKLIKYKRKSIIIFTQGHVKAWELPQWWGWCWGAPRWSRGKVPGRGWWCHRGWRGGCSSDTPETPDQSELSINLTDQSEFIWPITAYSIILTDQSEPNQSLGGFLDNVKVPNKK